MKYHPKCYENIFSRQVRRTTSFQLIIVANLTLHSNAKRSNSGQQKEYNENVNFSALDHKLHTKYSL